MLICRGDVIPAQAGIQWLHSARCPITALGHTCTRCVQCGVTCRSESCQMLKITLAQLADLVG